MAGEAALPLTGGMVFDGPPEQGASLKPEWSDRADMRLRWNLEHLASGKPWLSCDYAQGALRIAQKAPEGAIRCRAEFRREDRPRRLTGRFICNTSR
jgi:hypothetical protein